MVYPQVPETHPVKAKLTRLLMLAMAVALCSLPHAARACDACMGGKDPNVRPAINGAIFFMLGMVGMMAGIVGYCMRCLAKRASMPLPPYAELLK